MPKTADIRAVGEVAASRYGVVTTRQAAAVDISKRVLDRLVHDGVLDRRRPNVYVFTSHLRSWRQGLYVATVDRPAAASLLSAAALHVLDGQSHPPDIPMISCHHRRRIHDAQAHVHLTRSLPSNDITVVDNIPCTTLARTVIDLRAIVDDGSMMRMLDDLQRRGASMQWVFERAERLLANGRSGPRQVLDETRRRLGGAVVPDSWFERLLAECLKSPLLGDLVCQHELRDEAGNFVARFDLAIPWVRLAIEGHSRAFHFGQLVEAYDEDRDMRIAKCGWDVQYLGFAATKSPQRVRDDIEHIVWRRALDLGCRPPITFGSRFDAV